MARGKRKGQDIDKLYMNDEYIFRHVLYLH